MAKENYVSLKGQLRSDVRFIIDEETNEAVSAIFPLLVIRRNIKDRAGNLNPKFDRVIIQTSNPEMILAAKKLATYNIVEVKGTFRTQRMTRNKYCPKCGKLNIIADSSIQTINPTFIGILSTEPKTDIEGTRYLLDVAEVSNIAKIIGRVCSPTENITLGETDLGVSYCKYQLAVNRKHYVEGSAGIEDHTDYPIVYSYGSVAEDDYAVLQQGALVYIDGYVRTSTLETTHECDECKESFTYTNKRMTISPYAVEYLRDFKGDVLESTHGEEVIQSKGEHINDEPV